MLQVEADLSLRLQEIENVIDVPKVLVRNADDPASIAKYYKKNRLAYRLFNSHKGFVHMGISNDGSFDSTDFYAQAKLVLTQIDKLHAHNVLELAPGKAATLKYLAKTKPGVQFYGVDLPNGQFRAKTRVSNIALSYGDYHDLSRYADESMDIIYVIEALCHAHNKNQVIAECRRVLRNGGRLLIIDGYFSKVTAELTDNQKTAVTLVAHSMMVTDRQQDYQTLRKLLEANGFSITRSVNYSKNIMPSLYRLEHLAARFIRHPKLAKATTSLAGDIVTANAAAGYLMPLCVEGGLLEYRYTVATK